MTFKKTFLSSMVTLGLVVSSLFISNATSQQLEVNHINVGENSYGHPTSDALNRYKSIGAKVYRTDQLGNIVIKTDGNTFTINDNSSISLSGINDITGHWAEKQIKDFINKGYLSGYPDGTFKPQNSIKRAEFVKILNKVFGLKTKSNKVFNDTKNHWAKDEIDIAVTNGICQGTSATTFEPDAPITREAAAKMIANYKKIADTHNDKINGYSDASQVSSWAIKEVEAILEAGYMNGYSDTNTFKPKNNITRAEAVVTLGRVIDNPNPVIPAPPVNENTSSIVYINGGSSSSNKYHKSSNAHGMKDSIKMTESEAKKKGYVACNSCYK